MFILVNYLRMALVSIKLRLIHFTEMGILLGSGKYYAEPIDYIIGEQSHENNSRVIIRNTWSSMRILVMVRIPSILSHCVSQKIGNDPNRRVFRNEIVD